MKPRNFFVLAAFGIASSAFAADPASQTLLKQALAAQGGEPLLRSVKSISFESSGYRNMLEQSERPEGPYLIEFHDLAELRDHANRGLFRHLQVRTPLESYTSTMTVANQVAMQTFGTRQMPGTSQDVKIAAEALALSPERVLLTALDAADTHREADTVLHGVPHQVVGFTLDGGRAHIYLNQYTHLPSAIDYAGPLARGGNAAYLGDVVQRTAWSFWRLDKSGLRYPMQWDVQINGMPDRTMMLRAFKVSTDYDRPLVEVPQAIAAQFKPDAPPRDPAEMPLGAKHPEIAPGIVLIEGAWNTALVDQGDGLVVIEAPISSSYSRKVLAEAERRYPGKPIKAMVTTSDSWPHLAGIREYVARGIPVYALDLSEPIVRRTLSAPYSWRGDTLHNAPRKADLRLVGGKTVIGTGPNRIELYPLRGATTERQMMAYLPAHKLLYGSDPFQKDRATGTYNQPQQVSELVQAVEREHLQVDRFFMMHMPVAPYKELLEVKGSED
ncbi:hypothetical protein [Massilia horti]|uniref:MBL fold metallo-hydrolase n=1 Tax=Massilia horti TaxID=2562153 RepID=A0A4Y9T1M6_9BURK|nr:hypothetical protein [Massilia horti]TFW33143.1 hypothetical protein E4O92_07735 [Massilia horti]